MPKIYIIEDLAMNAFATGRNAEHGVIALTSGIIAKLNKTELEGVIAHELSHIGNKDMLISTVIVILVGFITLLADWFRNWTFWGFHSRDDNHRGGGQAQAILFIIALVISILAPIAAILIQLAISRKREFLADASSALLTRYPEGLASALEKISQENLPLKKVNRATAHLFIVNPLKGKSILKFFATHPPIKERIAALKGKQI
jgi:heat shock protein HtpX